MRAIELPQEFERTLPYSVRCPDLELTVIIPVNNELTGLDAFFDELSDTVESLQYTKEVIWVDDGSTDGTAEELQRLTTGSKENLLIRLPRNLGQSAALWHGLLASRGERIVTLDGDGQIVPSDIAKLLGVLDACELAIGTRRRRADRFIKRAFSFWGNRIRNLLTGGNIPDSGCSLRAFRRELIGEMIPFAALHRFLPSIVELNGGRVICVEVLHRPRQAGRSHYGAFSRGILSLIDCLALSWLLGIRKLPSQPRLAPRRSAA